MLVVVALDWVLPDGAVAQPTSSPGRPASKSHGYACTPGYTGGNAQYINGQETWAWKYYGGSEAAATTGYHNCILYVAWRLEQLGTPDPGHSWHHDANWAGAIGGGNHVAKVGSAAWWGQSAGALSDGHVAWIEAVEGAQVLLVTRDTGMSLRAAGRRIEVMQLPENYLRHRVPVNGSTVVVDPEGPPGPTSSNR